MLVKDYLMSFDTDLIKRGDALQFWSTEFANMLSAHVTIGEEYKSKIQLFNCQMQICANYPIAINDNKRSEQSKV